MQTGSKYKETSPSYVIKEFYVFFKLNHLRFEEFS